MTILDPEPYIVKVLDPDPYICRIYGSATLLLRTSRSKVTDKKNIIFGSGSFLPDHYGFGFDFSGPIRSGSFYGSVSDLALLFTSIPDPDPPGSEIIWPQGSGSEIINFGSGSGSCSGSGSSPFSHQT